MKKLASLLSTVILTFAATTLPALAHQNGTFHAHPHGAKPDPSETTILLIIIGIVVAMMIGFVILIASKMKQQNPKDKN